MRTKTTKNARRVTLQDVARDAGYSVTAVSRALKDMPDIGPEAKARIKESAARLGYVTNQMAVALRSGRTHMITVILANLVNPFFNQVADYIQIAAQQQGYSLIILCSRDDPQMEMQLVEQTIANRSDGVLIFPTHRSGPAIERLQQAGIPTVLLCAELPPYRADTVIIDDHKGVGLLIEHLYDAGCRKMVYLSSSNSSPSYQPRKQGFLDACDALGIPQEDRRICYLPFLFISAHRDQREQAAVIDLLRELKRDGFTGLFVFCDVEAMRVMNAIEMAPDLKPEDFSIASIDNISEALISPIPLCSIDCGIEELGTRSVEQLITRMEGDNAPPKVIPCRVRLVCRGSCNIKHHQ